MNQPGTFNRDHAPHRVDLYNSEQRAADKRARIAGALVLIGAPVIVIVCALALAGVWN